MGLGNDYASVSLVFFLGLFFARLTGLALLVRNHDDLRLNKRPQTLGD